MSQFAENKSYEGWSVCQRDCTITITVKKRTKTSIVTSDNKRMKIHQTEYGEMVFPHGNYSMAIVIKARNESA